MPGLLAPADALQTKFLITCSRVRTPELFIHSHWFMSESISAYIPYFLHFLHALCACDLNGVHIHCVYFSHGVYILCIRSICLYIIFEHILLFAHFCAYIFYILLIDLNEHILGCRKKLFGFVGRTILNLTHFILNF